MCSLQSFEKLFYPQDVLEGEGPPVLGYCFLKSHLQFSRAPCQLLIYWFKKVLLDSNEKSSARGAASAEVLETRVSEIMVLPLRSCPLGTRGHQEAMSPLPEPWGPWGSRQVTSSPNTRSLVV